MAKKTDQETLQNFMVRLSPSVLERIDYFAEKGRLSRSQFVRNLIEEGLEETEMFDKVGLVRAAITVRDICSWMLNKGTKGLTGELDEGK